MAELLGDDGKKSDMKIGILQTGHVAEELKDEYGNYAGMFRHLLRYFGFELQTWNVIDNEFLLSSCQADGWLITGSKFGVHDQFPWIRRLEQFFRQCYADSRYLFRSSSFGFSA